MPQVKKSAKPEKGSQPTEEQGGRFKLNHSQHIGPDLDQEPNEETGKRPSRTWNAGEIVDAEQDLVFRHGEKFTRVGDTPKGKSLSGFKRGDPTPINMRTSAAAAPGGQVSTGRQQTTGLPERDPETGLKQKSGPMDPKLFDEEEARAADEAAESVENEDEENVDTDTSAEATGDEDSVDFGGMTVAKLKSYAEENEIDLGNAHTKAQILAKLKNK